jgi:hypothetical protein
MKLSRSANKILFFVIAAANGLDGALCLTDRNNVSGTILRLTLCAMFLILGLDAMENARNGSRKSGQKWLSPRTPRLYVAADLR